MSILGVTKDTEFEKEIDSYRKAEANGAELYSSLSFIAKEKGLDKLSDELMKIALDELKHAGLYATLNGHVDGDLFDLLKKMAQAESGAVGGFNDFAKRLREKGLEEAAKQIELAASDEGSHGGKLDKLIKEFS